jgi:hypothetical protein
MDTHTQNQAPNTTPINSNPAPAYTPTPVSGDHRKIGPVVAILVIVVVLIAAAIYLFASRVNTNIPSPQTNNQTSFSIDDDQSAAADGSVTPITNSSDDVGDLQADLDASVRGLDDQNF